MAKEIVDPIEEMRVIEKMKNSVSILVKTSIEASKKQAIEDPDAMANFMLSKDNFDKNPDEYVRKITEDLESGQDGTLKGSFQVKFIDPEAIKRHAGSEFEQSLAEFGRLSLSGAGASTGQPGIDAYRKIIDIAGASPEKAEEMLGLEKGESKSIFKNLDPDKGIKLDNILKNFSASKKNDAKGKIKELWNAPEMAQAKYHFRSSTPNIQDLSQTLEGNPLPLIRKAMKLAFGLVTGAGAAKAVLSKLSSKSVGPFVQQIASTLKQSTLDSIPSTSGNQEDISPSPGPGR